MRVEGMAAKGSALEEDTEKQNRKKQPSPGLVYLRMLVMTIFHEEIWILFIK